MATVAKIAKQAVHDKLESQIKASEAKLEMLKARAQGAKANLEIKAIAALSPNRKIVQRKFQDLKKADGDRWSEAKADLEDGIAQLENAAKEIETRAKQG